MSPVRSLRFHEKRILNVFDLSPPIVHTGKRMTVRICVLIFYVLALFCVQTDGPSSICRLSEHSTVSQPLLSKIKDDTASLKSTAEHTAFQNSFLAKRSGSGKPLRLLYFGLSKNLKNLLNNWRSAQPSSLHRARVTLAFRPSPLQLIEVLLI